jgi:SAM-dependent methyltransferase
MSYRDHVLSLLRNVNRQIFPVRALTDLGTQPVSANFGRDRGTPIDRVYIEAFLQKHQHLVTGTTLEIAEDTYSRRFGQKVTKHEILHVDPTAPGVTIEGNLTQPEALPHDRIDCFICTQTYNFIADVETALRGTYQLLKPGGVVLATVGGISQVSTYDSTRWGDYWRFTPQGIRYLFERVFPEENVEVEVWGNCFATTLFLQGLAYEEIDARKLYPADERYPVTISVVARKPEVV